MSTSTSVFIILSCIVVSLLSQTIDGTNSYCMQARHKPFWSVPISAPCCDIRRKCGIQIAATETKFGLKNPDPKWSRRLCSCDLRLYRCITWGLSLPDKAWARYGFAQETCFREKPKTDAHKNRDGEAEYEFVRVLDIIDGSET